MKSNRTVARLKKIGMIALFFIGVASANANATDTGVWIPVYGGNPQPIFDKCVYHWWHSDCIVGDVRTRDSLGSL